MSDRSEPIAVVGIGCRYADVRGPVEFDAMVRGRRNTVREAPQHRIELGYDVDHFYDPRPRIPGKISSKKGGFLEHPELFDPEAFGIAPRDALTMEPQQRLLIEVTWDALDDAGIPPESILGERVAVILGYMAEDYSRERAGVLGEAAVYRGHDVFTVGGMSHAVLSGRISYLLGVTGPSLTLDTACSSSLYAAHLACESLRRGESKLAITGGANLFLSPEGNIALSRSGMLSMSGACKAFDASADGFVRAEGAGVVVLRPLSDALAAGNPIYAVIRGSGISADGRDGGHMMAPGRKGQAQAMHDAYAMAGVSPADVHYVEAHGTGTMIGDPVEIGALADVMGPGRAPDRPLRVASIKGNLGHTESASGVAGLINACLAIHHRRLPPQLHFETPNPMIPWAEVPIQVQRELEPWPYPGTPLVGVNSFGISGTNAHFVLEAAPEPDAATQTAATSGRTPAATAKAMSATTPAVAPPRPILLPITAHDPNALHELALKIRDQLVAEPDLELRDVAYTLARRRSLRAHRLCVVARTKDEARQALDAYLAGEASPDLRTGLAGAVGAKSLVMVFPGQGPQWLGMGRSLLASEPVFAEAIERIDAAYRAHVDWSLRAVLEGCSPEEGGVGADWTKRLDVLQPALVAVEVALAALWRHFGVEPQRVLGQSMGEIAAAHVAGALPLEDLARLACERGRVVARAAGRGTMAVVSLGRERVERRLAEGFAGVEIAGSNSPTTTILSGDTEAVLTAVATFEAEGVFARRLEVDFASHCFHMDPLLEPFRRAIGTIAAGPAAIAIDSTVDGETKPGESLGADYWIRNLRAPVAFDRGLAASLEGGGEVFLEVSPHPALPRAIDETAQSLGHAPRYVASLRRGEDEARCLLVSLAELFVRGQAVDWATLLPEGRVAPLPLYTYQRKRYFFSERTRQNGFRPTHPLLGQRTDSSLDPRLHSWDFPLDADSGSFLVEERFAARAGNVSGSTPLSAPASLAVELALAAGASLFPGARLRIRDLAWTRALALGAEGRRTVQVVAREEGGTGARAGAELRLASRAGRSDAFVVHGTGRLECLAAAADTTALDTIVAGVASEVAPAVDPLVREGNVGLSIDDYYAALERCGVGAGSKGRVLRELEADGKAGEGLGVVGKLMLPRSLEAEWYAYHAHPLLLESAFQMVGELFERPAGVRILSLESVELFEGLGSDCLCRARRRATKEGRADALVADLDFFDRKGRILGSIRGLCAEALPIRGARGLAAASEWHAIEWVNADFALLESERELDRFILVSDSEANAAWLASELAKQGVEIRFCEKVEDLEPLVRLLRATGDGRYGFLLLAWGEPSAEAKPEPTFQRDFRVGQWAAAIREHTADAAQIWIATRGLQPRDDEGGGDEAGESDAASPVRDVRLGRRVAREIDTFASCAEMQQCRLFDAERALGEADLVWLAALVGRPGLERQFVMRRERALVPRLVPIAEEAASSALSAGARRAAGEAGFRVALTGAEGRRAVAFVGCAPRALGPDEVRVEVRTASLGAFDVMTGLGLARGEAARTAASDESAAGLDFAGVVKDVGSRVRDLAVGTRVVGVRPAGALIRELVLPRRSVAELAPRLDFATAASVAWPGLVARHVLCDVARVRAGERVLVVSAGGAVGLSLVARARALGAEVQATAGTAPRRAALVAAGATILDEEAAFDVVVSAESGPALHARLASLAPGGRYVDLCPRDRFERPELGALKLGANRAYLPVDCLEALVADAKSIGDRLRSLMSELETGTIEPIPLTLFPVAESARALRFMTQNRHVGRVVVDFDAAASVAIAPAPGETAATLAARRFVVSGGAASPRVAAARSALAQWLRGNGAAGVVELDGSSPSSSAISATKPTQPTAPPPPSDPVPAKVEPADVWIHVSDESLPGHDPLRHRLAESAHGDRVLISLREPVVGEADRDRAWEARLWVDRLVLAGAGPGGGRALGLSLGRDTSPASVVRAFERVWREGEARAQRVVLSPAELSEGGQRAPSPLMEALGLASHAGAGPRAFDRAGFLGLTPPERRAALLRHVREELAGVLGLGADRRDELDPALRLDALGLDSLMTMELFMGLGRGLELTLAADWFPAGPTLAEIAQVLTRRLEASLAAEAA